MIRLIVVVPLLVSLRASPSPKEHSLAKSGIVGGEHARDGQFPYQLSLQLRRIHICGAALVSTDIAITAAHCTRNENVKYLSVIAGTIDRQDDGERIFVKYCEDHNKFNPHTNDNDISLLFLKKGFPLGGRIKLIAIAKANEVIPAGAYATVSGWGVNKPTGDNTGANSRYLKFANIPIWKGARCRRRLPEMSSAVYCGGIDSGLDNACAGDSGSPLVYKNKLFGVVTFGFGCGKPNEPVVYTNVAAHRLWITRKLLGLLQINLA